MIHGDGKTKEATLVDWILERYPEIKGVGEPIILSSGLPSAPSPKGLPGVGTPAPKGEEILRPGIVHRLDKDTSGVLLIVKDQETFLALKKQFQDSVVKKRYTAIVYGKPRELVGVINKPIGRSKGDFRLRTTETSMRGKIREAVTEYHVIKSEGQYSLVDMFPKTGRTHQIRVHLKSIGHPVVCDSLYGKGRLCPPELGRLALHAASIEFEGGEGEKLKIEAPLPLDMQMAIKNLFDH